MFSIKKKLAETAKRAGLMTIGFTLCVIGAGFFTLAAWFALLTVLSPWQAALILGAAYFGLGLLLVGMARNAAHTDVRVEQPAAAAPRGDAPPLVQALLFGIQAGLNTSKPKK